MPLVTARVIAACWDSPTAQGFARDSIIEGFDPESESGRRLSSLKTGMGEWIFQYPGHEGKVVKPEAVKAVEPLAPPVEAKQTVDKRHQPMSEAHKKAMIAGRARKKAEKEARLAVV